MTDSNAQALRELANTHLATILEKLPRDDMGRFILFIEVVRAMDYWGIHVPAQFGDSENVEQSLDLMYWGWNRAVAELFTPLNQVGAFPLMESTPESRGYAAGLMQEFGKVSLLCRLSDMSERGIMEITKEGNEFQVCMADDARAQFADATELDRFQAAEARLPLMVSDWTMVSMEDAQWSPDMPGNHWVLPDQPAKHWIRSDIEELIRPLVRPWETRRGVMVAYDARPEVDAHFMAEALDLATSWREDSGIHPNAMLGSFTGADVAAVGAALISLHSKHFACVSVAKKLFSQVSVPMSLTIWGPRNDLEESISIMSNCSQLVVQEVFNTLAMTSEQAKRLSEQSTPLIPLLFDLGNGFILRPISCLTRNPFNAVKTQHQWKNPNAANAIAVDREDWMRKQLYAMFAGWRYICFPSNLKLRRNGATVTDIDAIVYDRISGEVGLFQLKWQDYSTNDVCQLRSKASNLSAELVHWAGIVNSWIEENGLSTLDKSLRLKRKRRETVKSFLLFAISRSLIRTRGYGVNAEIPGLAMAVWPQFARARMEIGPSKQPLRDIHERLIKEHGQLPDIHPMPVSIQVADITLQIQDLWNTFESPTKEGQG